MRFVHKIPIIIAAWCFLSFSGKLLAVATNDLFANRILLQGSNVVVSANNTSATTESGEPLPLAGAAGRTLWYSWVAPFTGRANISSRACCFFCDFGVYTGPDRDHLQRVASDRQVFSWFIEEGQGYQIQADTDAGSEGDFTFTIYSGPYPPTTNDAFSSSIWIRNRASPGGGARINDATLEPGEPTHRDGAPSKSLWWHWQVPNHTSINLYTAPSAATNVMYAVYTGDSLETLTLVAKQFGSMYLPFVAGGTMLHIAVVVDPPTKGDVSFYFGYNSGLFAPSIAVPGNLLCEPSFEGTALVNFNCWHFNPNPGGYVGERGGADGTTWPILNNGSTLWQEFATVPGHLYQIQFAIRPENGATNGHALIQWDSSVIGEADSPGEDGVYWHWIKTFNYASNTTSRLTVVSQSPLGVDAFSVVDLSAPPTISKQPASVSTVTGGSASFFVGAQGAPPLSYQWLFNGSVLPGATNLLITLSPAFTNQVGSYLVRVANSFGAITSAVAMLAVDAPIDATILSQPYGDTVPVGGYHNFTVIAGGSAPLTYQWLKGNDEIAQATNRNLPLSNVQLANAGIYRVRVQNSASTVWSLPVTLTVSTNSLGGGLISFRNQFTFGNSNAAPVFDIDQITPLSGSHYVAQLYSGPSLDLLRAVGQPTPFQSGFNSGFFTPQVVTLPNVAPGSNAVLQVRVWDQQQATSYEEARAIGAQFGKSLIIEQATGSPPSLPPQMLGLQSFSLQAGLPFFNVASIHSPSLQPNGTIVWTLQAEPGFRYLIERNIENSVWNPFVVVTNITGSVTFSDSKTNNATVVFYRSRILD